MKSESKWDRMGQCSPANVEQPVHSLGEGAAGRGISNQRFRQIARGIPHC